MLGLTVVINETKNRIDNAKHILVGIRANSIQRRSRAPPPEKIVGLFVNVIFEDASHRKTVKDVSPQ